jgi:hypothetical protein
MYLTEELSKTWAPVLDHPELEPIKDPYKRAVTTVILENQRQAMAQDRLALNETATGGSSGPNVTGSGISNFDPILISLVRRSLPNLIAYDVAGVQPMTGPTGLIFAMRARYTNQSGTEAFFNEANTAYTGVTSVNNPYGFRGTATTDVATNPVSDFTANAFTTGIARSTATAEFLG